MKKLDPRFAQKIGAEYALFPLAAPHYGECQKLVAEIATLHSGNRLPVLELGCGTGLTNQELRRRMPSARITAVDTEEVMIAQAQELLGDSVEFVCEDALGYLQGQPDGSFGCVVTAFCFHNMPPDYRAKVFNEIGRVLCSGGALVVGDKIAQDDVLEHWESLKVQIDAFAVFQTTDYPELQAEWTAHYLEDDRIRLTEKEQRELFALAGCTQPQLHRRWCMDAVFSGVKE